jgi:hypothetical protein
MHRCRPAHRTRPNAAAFVPTASASCFLREGAPARRRDVERGVPVSGNGRNGRSGRDFVIPAEAGIHERRGMEFRTAVFMGSGLRRNDGDVRNNTRGGRAGASVAGWGNCGRRVLATGTRGWTTYCVLSSLRLPLPGEGRGPARTPDWVPAFAGKQGERSLRCRMGEEAAGASLPPAPGAGRLDVCFRRDSKASRLSEEPSGPVPSIQEGFEVARAAPVAGDRRPSGSAGLHRNPRREDHRHCSALQSDASSNVPG